MVQAEGRFEPGWRYIPIFFSNDFYLSFVRPDGLNDELLPTKPKVF